MGKDIKRYQINYHNRFILFDRNKLHRARPDYIWEAPKKIIIQQISGGSKPLASTIDNDKYYCFASTNLLLIKKDYEEIFSYELICALLNSNLINFYYSKNFSNESALTVNISKTFLEMIPLPSQNNIKKSSVSNLVSQILESKKQLHSARTDKDKSYYELKCRRLDKQIDSEVYKLYNLTEEEIKIVEGKD